MYNIYHSKDGLGTEMMTSADVRLVQMRNLYSVLTIYSELQKYAWFITTQL